MNLKPTSGAGTEPEWFRSSHSAPDGTACVEVASTHGTIHVRDSKHIPGPQQWAAFLPYAADHT